jgi:predicted RNase H-like nuclease
VRWFGLKERIPYKRGKVAERRKHFAQLQEHLRDFIQQQLPELVLAGPVCAMLQSSWTKDTEDQTDAVLAALMGYWHYKYAGARSQILGDVDTGFILVPR